MIRLAICDDDLLVCSSIENMIEKMQFNNISLDIFNSGDELINYLNKNKEQYNIYILDIEMQNFNGIETAAYIRKKDHDSLIIFVTNHKEYVYEVFQVLPFRFICKPVQFNILNTVIDDAIKHIQRENQLYFFQVGHEKMQIPYKEIFFFEGAGRKVRVHSINRIIEYYDKISKVLNKLDNTLFTQIHGSYIINMEFIRIIKQDEVELAENVKLPISRKYHQNLHQNHMTFLKRRGGF